MEQPLNKDITGMIVAKQLGYYKLIKRLGSGAFGEIYKVENSNPGSKYGPKDVAMKIEKADSKHPQVFFEAKLYNYLNSHLNCHGDKGQLTIFKLQLAGIPKVYQWFSENGFNFMVMDLLGLSLEDLFSQQNRRFSLQTVLLIAIQSLESIEFLHSKQFIHRDIKPDNFLIGAGQNSHKVFMVDLGLAKRYISKDGHIPYKENKSLTGTARYASINTHLGIEQSRRDDLESLGYVLIYLLKGQLPWQNLRANNQKEKYERIMEKKLATSTESLCKGYAEQFSTYINYCKNLKFDEKPDYNMLRQLFKDVMIENECEFKYIYDWNEDEGNAPDFQVLTNIKKNQKSQMSEINQIQKNLNSSVPSEKLPSIKKGLNPTASILIQQLQKQQVNQQSNNKRKIYGRPGTNMGQRYQQQKTSSQNSIVRQQSNSQNRTIEQGRQMQSQNQLYRTLYSQEKYKYKNRQLRQLSKQVSNQKSFQ